MHSSISRRPPEWYAELRRRAEELASPGKTSGMDCPSGEIYGLVHDLHVSHLELEMQNEDLRRTHLELETIRRKFSDLYDFAPVSYLTLDQRGFVEEINLAGSALLCLDRIEIIGKLLVTFVVPADRDKFRQLHRAVLKSSETRRCELQLIRNDESVAYTRIEAVAIRDKTSSFRGSRLIIHDITERKRVEDALYEEKERAQITLRSIGDAVITTSKDGLVDFLNPVAETLTGWCLDEAIGQPLDVVFHVVSEQTGKPVADPVKRCLHLGRIVGLCDHSLLVNRSGQEYAIQDSAAPIRDKQDTIVGAVLVFQDVTEARRLAQQVAHQANHDPLTGLVNRREFEKRLERALASAKLHEAQHALCFLDLDGFKAINDSAGHAAGDELLKQIASVLSRFGRSRDTLARIGGDEFCLLIENCPVDKALKIAQRIVAAVGKSRFVWNNRGFCISGSIGLIAINQGSESVRQILTEADVACYRAKDLGRNRVYLHHKFDCNTGNDSVSLVKVKDLQGALEHNRFSLYCQPIRALKDNGRSTAFYEVLLRLLDEDDSVISPEAFIPVAERFGVMPSIDRWVIRHALLHMAELMANGTRVTLSINLSGHSINDESLLQFISEALDDAKIPGDRLCLEITETAAIHNFSHAAHLIEALRKRGCRFSLDDFGKGVSSMSYLKHLSVDFLKIDGGFILNMADNKIDYAMVSAMNEMAHALGVATIAESVESASVIRQLAQLGVDYVQGFAIGRPAPMATLTPAEMTQVAEQAAYADQLT